MTAAPAPAWTRAFSTLGCPDFALDAVLALAARHRVSAIELRALNGTVDLPALLADRFGTPDRFASVIAASGVSLAAFGTSARLLEDRPGDRDALRAFVPWAEAAGVPYLRIFDGGDAADADELALAAAMMAWWRAERTARTWSVDLIVETHDALAAPAALARFVAAMPGVGLLWDTHHTWKKGGQDPAETWAIVRASARHLHVKDSISRPGLRLPYTYVLPGHGDYPMATLRRVLAADGYAGAMSLEWERMWHPELPPLDDALTAASAWDGGWW